MHLCSDIFGVEQTFSLYALPNSAEFYQSSFDKSALVPVLVGMGYLGQHGHGMMLDFTTGLAMSTKEEEPDIFQLSANKKGHFVFDIVQH